MTKIKSKDNKKMKNAVYKMIDFSEEDGQLFISIKHNCKNKDNVKILLVSRENKNNIIDIPVKKYGFHLEASINVDDIFNNLKINQEQIWDIYLYDNDEKINISIEKFKSFMVDYHPMKERLYIVKPYVTGLDTLALFIKNDKMSFNMVSFKEESENYSVSISFTGEYIKEINSRIENSIIYFKKRNKNIGKNKYTYFDNKLIRINTEISNNNLIFQINFKEALKYEELPLEKNPLDGFVKINDRKGSEFEFPLVVETNWKDKPYKKINNKIKACWFKNYLDALSICTNSIK